jgi:ribonucleoside-diphosphate reductase beta chain
MLESINFMASFAVTFGIAETGIFQGIASDVKLIGRDEMLHARVGAKVLNILMKEWPETFIEMRPEMEKMLHAVVADEKAWPDHLFSNGRQVIGLNAKILKDYVQYAAAPVARTIGVKWDAPVKNPLPYMDSWLDSSKTQTAAQELQVTNYLLNSIKASSEAEIEETLKRMRAMAW